MCGVGTLVDESGELVGQGTVQRTARHGSIGDALEWRWIAPGIISFKCRLLRYPLPPRVAEQFQRLCALLVANYPTILQRPWEANAVRLYEKTEAQWKHSDSDGMVRISLEEYPKPQSFAGTVISHTQVERLVGRNSKPRTRTG